MTTELVTSQGFVQVEGYRLNVTYRLDPDNREHGSTLVEKTVKLWLYVAKLIQADKRIADYKTSPEEAIKPNHFIPLAEQRVTVWADLGSNGFTVHSSYTAQDALDCYWSRLDGLKPFAIVQEPPKAPPTPQNTNTPKPAENAANANVVANAANSVATQNAIAATRAPNPKEVVYPDGQLVTFAVNKVAMGANKGSATYALWGSLGQKYPLMTIYKNKPNSSENSPNYAAIKDFVAGLGLSVDAGKVEALGDWVLICKAVHVPQSDGTKKEYLNVVSMNPVAIGRVA